MPLLLGGLTSWGCGLWIWELGSGFDFEAGFGVRAWGLGFRAWDLGFKFWGLGCGI